MSKSVKAAALRFLKIRPRSIMELKEKLQVKGFSSPDIEVVVHDLIASGLLDDRAFTTSWINDRLARPFGFRRIVQELRAKGVDQEIIEQAKAQVIGSYDPYKTALELARRRWQRLPAIEDERKRKRVLDFLLRRGFELDVVMQVLRRIK